MSGYIGSKTSVTLVDGYAQAEADAEFVQDPNGAITVDGSGNVGIGTGSPQATAEISGGLDNRLRINSTDGTTSNNYGVDFSTAGTVRSGIRYNAGNNYLAFYGFNNTERMRIDSAGRVTMPYQPAFHAYGNGATSSMTAAGANPVYNVTAFNIGNCYSTTNGVFTAQVGGVYYFAMGVYMFANSAHNRIELKASTGVFQYEISSPSSAAHSEMLTGTIYLNAGDTCYPWIQSDSNSTYYRAQHHSWFEGYLVG